MHYLVSCSPVGRSNNVWFMGLTELDITCARNGLSESELEDILACDDEVLNDIYEW